MKNDRDGDRRRRFAAYFNGTLKGDRAAFRRKTGYSKGRLTQLLDENEAFGEAAAGRVAERLGLPKDFFERDEVNAGFMSRLMDAVLRLDDRHRQLLLTLAQEPEKLTEISSGRTTSRESTTQRVSGLRPKSSTWSSANPREPDSKTKAPRKQKGDE